MSTASSASRCCTALAVLRGAQRLDALQRCLGVAWAMRARSSAISSESESSLAITPPASTLSPAATAIFVRRPAAKGLMTTEFQRAAGADRRQLVVDGAGSHRLRSPPASVLPAPPGRLPPLRACAGAAFSVEACAQSMPQRASTSREPGTNSTHAAAAATSDDEGQDNLLPGGHLHSGLLSGSRPQVRNAWRSNSSHNDPASRYKAAHYSPVREPSHKSSGGKPHIKSA